MSTTSILLTFLLLLFSLVSFCSCDDTFELFERWCNQHGKTYSSQEEKNYRFKVFEDNYAFVTKHNEIGNSSFTLSLNAFADLTVHEFKVSRLGLSPALLRFDHQSLQQPHDLSVLEDLPSEIDWRKKGAVTNVKDQGSCGICCF